MPRIDSKGSTNSSEQKREKLVTHRTQGSVLDELNMSEQDRLELKLKADLHQDILKLIQEEINATPTGKAF